ncbi:hypothetical protein [Zooshikella ganghwensis]|uniref:hypothetical protein n=1 Tax=Zooshikella ganghwensis TaxID=202772 RepID=UPI0013FE11F6|nr:hypothetical protein [Zooshikella ganghwensis]
MNTTDEVLQRLEALERRLSQVVVRGRIVAVDPSKPWLKWSMVQKDSTKSLAGYPGNLAEQARPSPGHALTWVKG